MRITRQHSILISVAVAVIAVIGWFFLDAKGVKGPSHMWFYDLNTGELFIAEASAIPPVAAPSGDLIGSPGVPAGVSAKVVRVKGESARKIAFLQTYSESSRPGTGVPMTAEMITRGALVALPPAHVGDQVSWIQLMSPEGNKIVTAAATDGKPYTIDLP